METLELSNWGGYPRITARVHSCEGEAMAQAVVRRTERLIARGNGCCYGDSSLQTQVLATRSLQRIHHLDTERELLRAEAGCTLGELLDFLIPRGFCLPVLPGSQYISLGGAIAANAHGKDHRRRAALGAWLRSIRLLKADGSIVDCSSERAAEDFYATIGGLGLTGVILAANLRVRPIETSYLEVESLRSGNLAETMRYLAEAEHYAVAWLEGTVGGRRRGRGLVGRARPLSRAELPPAYRAQPLAWKKRRHWFVPTWFPTPLLNATTLRGFNRVYYHRQSRRRQVRIEPYASFFFPLDTITHWNRLYGTKGFVQYQFVLPLATSEVGLEAILGAIEAARIWPYLSVLKLLGPEKLPVASLSFPREGYTLALDFPRRPAVLALLDRLDALVIQYGGRVYLAKDARLSKPHFQQMYPTAFPHPDRFHSLQSQRLGIS
ncbi:MAG: FAD-binding oxidoreductase [Bacteroidota bacterium]